MTQRNDNDAPIPTRAAAAQPSRTEFRLHELSEMLSAPVERIQIWLHDAGVQPLDAERPDRYGPDAIELFRARGHML